MQYNRFEWIMITYSHTIIITYLIADIHAHRKLNRKLLKSGLIWSACLWLWCLLKARRFVHRFGSGKIICFSQKKCVGNKTFYWLQNLDVSIRVIFLQSRTIIFLHDLSLTEEFLWVNVAICKINPTLRFRQGHLLPLILDSKGTS